MIELLKILLPFFLMGAALSGGIYLLIVAYEAYEKVREKIKWKS